MLFCPRHLQHEKNVNPELSIQLTLKVSLKREYSLTINLWNLSPS